jgi:succinate dehydrogenase flavin-adding protein (antitoxin of CptAB toxin-antitoxin module)
LYAGVEIDMSRIEQIEHQIKELSAEELRSLRAWFDEYDAELWDRQIEADVNAGRLDELARSALNDHADERSTEL